MEVLETEFIKEFIKTADNGWNMGWHERNGGNLSYRIPQADIDNIKDKLSYGEWLEIGASVPLLSNEYFVVTGTGRYFSNIKEKPQENIGIIQIDETGEKYRICWGYEGGGRPTSELPTHLMNLEIKKSIDDDMRIVYHAHSPAIISLSFLMEANDIIYTRELWEMMPECSVVFPEGVGVLPFMVPGTEEIGKYTSEKMKTYNAVIWSCHGVFVSGRDFDEAFGLLHTIEKAADMLIRVMSAGGKVVTMSANDLRKIAVRYNLNLDEKFLYEKKN